MLERVIEWVHGNTLPGQGVIVHSGQAESYPEVTGYFIPSLLATGHRRLAHQYARWLATIQKTDGSFGPGWTDESFAFDTSQVVRGWVEVLPQMPELEQPLRRACEWLISSADSSTGRLQVPRPGGSWSLGRRGEVSEAIHLFALRPLQRAGELLEERRYRAFAGRALDYYLQHFDLDDFEAPNALTHFYGYVQEALVELGCEEVARRGMASVARFQDENGAVPAYSDVNWTCSTGLAQLALVWYRLGEVACADRAMECLTRLQNPSGGFYGSYGSGAAYFPTAEISWAAKFVIDASFRQITAHFDATTIDYAPRIDASDGRVKALFGFLGDLDGRRVLDAGCGKGRYSALLQERFPGARITGVDISANMLSHVPTGVRPVRGHLLHLPFADEAFDAVLCVEALEHAVNIGSAVRQMCRVLKPGGRLVVIDKNRQKLGALAMPHWEQWFSDRGLACLLEEEDLDAQVEPVGYDDVRQPDGLFLCWTGVKRTAPARRRVLRATAGRRRLAVVPTDPLRDYAHKSSAYLRDYFNPLAYFDDVYCLSPLEAEERVEHGMHIIPTRPAELATRLRDLAINVVRAYGGFWACDFAAGGKVPGVPLVVSVHDQRPELLHDTIHAADLVISVSPTVRDLVAARGVPPERSLLLPNRVDTRMFRPGTDPDREAALARRFPATYRILHVGRKAPEKNLDTLVRALPLLGPDYRAVFLGAGNAAPYERLAADLGVAGQCNFEGTIPHDDLPAYYSFFDCMCTPSRFEGFGMVFTEALACSGVVVTSDIAPMNGYIEDGRNGLLVARYEDPAALAGVIRQACTDAGLRARVKAAAPGSVTCFAKERIDQQEVDIYEMILSRARDGAL